MVAGRTPRQAPSRPFAAPPGPDAQGDEMPKAPLGVGREGSTEAGSGKSIRFLCDFHSLAGFSPPPAPVPLGPLPRPRRLRFQLLMKNCSSSIQEAAKEESPPGAALG